MSAYHAKKMGAHSNVVLLSWESGAHIEGKHRARQRTRDLNLYRLAETIITEGMLYQDAANSMLAVWKSPPNEHGKSEIYKAAMKATKNGNEIYLASVHRIDERGLRALQRRAQKFGRGVV
jgi:hypothetical protein